MCREKAGGQDEMRMLRAMYAEGEERLRQAGIEEAGLDAWYLLEFVTGVDKAHYYMNPDRRMKQSVAQEYEKVVKLRTEHIPLQHITGVQEFMGLEFQVSGDVLIPRQDTEVLVEEALKRLEQGKTVKEYLNLDDTEGSRRLIRAIHKIETNQKEIYIREFSVQCFGDSKELEKKSGLIGKIFRRFSDDMEDMDNDVILAEYGIYRTPNYVYVKGSGRLRIGTPEAYDIDLRSLRQGIGLSGEDLDGLEWKVDVSVKRIITIENLTTFFRWEEPDSVLIYLGGYHNAVRRKFLQKLYQVFPEAEYFHFGDIDVGGFEIYEDLCRRTGIPFTTYKMGISELEQYEQYTRELTENDRKRMDSLLNNEAYENVWPILRYMKEHGKKLEQESIL